MKNPNTLTPRAQVTRQLERLSPQCHKHPLLALEEADIALRLHQLRHRASLLTPVEDGAVVGLYGDAPQGKSAILAALTGSGDGRVIVALGERQLDYLQQVNPGLAHSGVAIRLVPPQTLSNPAYPVRIALLSEGDLAHWFCQQYYQGAQGESLSYQEVEQRLAWLAERRVSLPAFPLNPDDAARVMTQVPQHSLPVREQQLRLIQLLSHCEPGARARGWSLLWQDEPQLTARWQALYAVLQQLHFTPMLFAPDTLLIDRFGLPQDTLFDPLQNEGDDDVLVPVMYRDCGEPVLLSSYTLAQLSREVVLPLTHQPVLSGLHILDFPLINDTQASKNRLLLELATEQCQPEILLLTNPVNNREQHSTLAPLLHNWGQSRVADHAATPPLVWAITEDNLRFSGQLWDEALQRCCGKPGQHWGALQALNQLDRQRLVEWLRNALQPAQRQQQQARLEADLLTTLALVSAPLEQKIPDPAALIKILQKQMSAISTLQSELAAVALRAAHACQGLPGAEGADKADLARFSPLATEATEQRTAIQAPYRQWVFALRDWAFGSETSGLDLTTRHQLVTILVAAGWENDLPQQLCGPDGDGKAGVEEITRTLGRFIAWLGYLEQPEADRPRSRANPGHPVFYAGPRPLPGVRMTRLPERALSGSAEYGFDWLMALYHHGLALQHQQPGG